MAVIQAACTCGTKVEIRTGSDSSSDFRADGKQAVYPGEMGYCIFRCRDCLQPLHETVAELAFEAKAGQKTNNPFNDSEHACELNTAYDGSCLICEN